MKKTHIKFIILLSLFFNTHNYLLFAKTQTYNLSPQSFFSENLAQASKILSELFNNGKNVYQKKMRENQEFFESFFISLRKEQIEDVYEIAEKTYLIQVGKISKANLDIIIEYDEDDNLKTAFIAKAHSIGAAFKNYWSDKKEFLQVFPITKNNNLRKGLAKRIIKKILLITEDRNFLKQISKTTKFERLLRDSKNPWHVFNSFSIEDYLKFLTSENGDAIIHLLSLPEAKNLSLSSEILPLESLHLTEASGAYYHHSNNLMLFHNLNHEILAHEIMHHITAYMDHEKLSKLRSHFINNLGLLVRIIFKNAAPHDFLLYLDPENPPNEVSSLLHPTLSEAIAYTYGAIINNSQTTQFNTPIAKEDISIFKELGLLPDNFSYELADINKKPVANLSTVNFYSTLQDVAISAKTISTKTLTSVPQDEQLRRVCNFFKSLNIQIEAISQNKQIETSIRNEKQMSRINNILTKMFYGMNFSLSKFFEISKQLFREKNFSFLEKISLIPHIYRKYFGLLERIHYTNSYAPAISSTKAFYKAA